LTVSKSFRISNYGYAGSIFSACETISEALFYSDKYGCLAHTLGKFQEDPNTDETAKLVRYIWTPSFTADQDEKFRQITECILSNYALTMKWLSWNIEGHIHKVTFRHKLGHLDSQYKDTLGCDVEFNDEQNALLIDRKYLEASIPTANPLKLSILQKKLNPILAQYNQESDLIGRVEYAIKELIQTSRPTFSAVASELSVSERSLKRYLHKKNVRFKDVLKDVRIELCSIYMEQGVSYSEIAQLLWYADQSAFTRAYKKWHGVSPSKHRAEKARFG